MHQYHTHIYVQVYVDRQLIIQLQKNRYIFRWIDIKGIEDRWKVDIWINGQMIKWINGQMDRWIDGYMDKQIDG